jgi:hypothetical protein
MWNAAERSEAALHHQDTEKIILPFFFLPNLASTGGFTGVRRYTSIFLKPEA